MVAWRWVLLVTLCGLGGCAADAVNPVATTNTSAEPEPQARQTDDCGSLENADRLRLSLIQDELNADRPRAALAYFDALPEQLKSHPRAIYQRAEAWRDIADYAQARVAYRELLSGCLEGAAYHGLGLVAAADNDRAGALDKLRRARELLAADPRVRNDYGYALLLDGQLPQARGEFQTALELSAQQPRAASNLVLVLLVEGNEKAALHVAHTKALDAEQLERLRSRADQLRTQLAEGQQQ
jgi:Flp pilus assembly protein TadD